MQRYFIDYSLKNGLGHPAISLYLTGCDNPVKCNGCHNYELQKQSYKNYSIDIIKQEIDANIYNYLQFHDKLFIAILGGEPLAEYNKKISLQISKHIKKQHRSSTIVVYSWRTYEQIQEDNLEPYIKYIDYGVLGVYDDTLYVENTLPASSNQYIYDFKHHKTLEPVILKGR